MPHIKSSICFTKAFQFLRGDETTMALDQNSDKYLGPTKWELERGSCLYEEGRKKHRPNFCENQRKLQTCHTAALVFTTISNRFWHAMPPLLCCVGPGDNGYLHTRDILFFTDKRIMPFTIHFVFAIKVAWSNFDNLDTSAAHCLENEPVRDCNAALQAIKRSMKWLTHLTIKDCRPESDGSSSVFGSTEADIVAAIPRSVQQLRVHRGMIDLVQMQALAAHFPDLDYLRANVDIDAARFLFRPSAAAASAATAASDGSTTTTTTSFFPRLRGVNIVVECTAGGFSRMELMKTAIASAIFPRLREFSAFADIQEEKDDDNADKKGDEVVELSLEPMRKCERLGDNFLSSGEFARKPLLLLVKDHQEWFGHLSLVREVGDNFFQNTLILANREEGASWKGNMPMGTEQEDRGTVLDMSQMVSLGTVGAGFFKASIYYDAETSFFDKVLLPPNLEEIGRDFFSTTPVKEIVFPNTIRSIDTEGFLQSTCIKNFDSRLLPTGWTGNKIGNMAFRCCNALVEINFGGCKGVTAVGDFVLFWCENLEHIRGMEGLAEVRTIGRSFAYSAQKVVEFDWTTLRELREYGDEALRHNDELRWKFYEWADATCSRNKEKS